MFKVVILVLLAVGYSRADEKAHLTPEQTSRLLGHSMQCIGETGVSLEAAQQARLGKFPKDEKFQKFIHCVMSKSGLTNKSGHAKVEKTLAQYPKDVDKEGVKKALVECNKEEGSSPTETTYKVFKCFHAKTPVHIAL